MHAMPLGFSFEDGNSYTVWIDYLGFKSELQVFLDLGASSTRPPLPTTICNVDVWGTLDISSSYNVGFAAYNSIEQAGVEHSLVDSISIADAYRPFDKEECAAYARCRKKDVDSLCISPVSSSRCILQQCDKAYIWDVTGTKCCALFEKASYSITGTDIGPFAAGQTVPCDLERKTITTLVNNSKCGL